MSERNSSARPVGQYNNRPLTSIHDPRRWDNLSDEEKQYNETGICLLIGNYEQDVHIPVDDSAERSGCPHASFTSIGWMFWNFNLIHRLLSELNCIKLMAIEDKTYDNMVKRDGGVITQIETDRLQEGTFGRGR